MIIHTQAADCVLSALALLKSLSELEARRPKVYVAFGQFARETQPGKVLLLNFRCGLVFDGKKGAVVGREEGMKAAVMKPEGVPTAFRRD